MIPPPPSSTLFPYTTLFRSIELAGSSVVQETIICPNSLVMETLLMTGGSKSASADLLPPVISNRSEEHTSELQSHVNIVCRLLLEKKKSTNNHFRRASSPSM